MAYLGAVLGTNGRVLDETNLTADDFEDPRHGEVFSKALGLYQAGRPVEYVTVASQLPSSYNALMIEALEWAGTSYAAAEYEKTLIRESTRRKLSVAGAAIAALDPQMEAGEMVDRAQSLIADASERNEKPKYQMVGDLLDEVLVAAVEESSFIPSPWRKLNNAIGGFRPGAVYVVAARPGVGKTVIAAQIATGLADHGLVGFSSLEMSTRELAQRFYSERAMVSIGSFKNNNLRDFELERIAEKRNVLTGLNVAVDDRTNISPVDVRRFVRDLMKRGHVSGLVVDYLQLMSTASDQRRFDLVTEFSRQMKVIAKDFHIPVIVLSQLNRASEARMDGKPKLSDLRESGAIEQDADVVMLLRREGDEPNEYLIIDVAKNRHGQTGEADLSWQGMYSRAVDLE